MTPAERAILDATEELLATTGLHDLTASVIMERAQISRPTFYSYFSSKHAVVAKLLLRVFDDIYVAVQPWVTAVDEERPDLVLREVLQQAAAMLHDHGAVLRAAHENAHVTPELGSAWYTTMERFRVTLEAQIVLIREAHGLPTDDAEQLSSTLIWASERVFYLSTRHLDPRISTSADAVEALLMIWIPSIYGAPYAGPAHTNR